MPRLLGDAQLNTGLERLNRDECLRLLGTEQVGRLSMVGDQGRPEIFPINYVLDGEEVLFRTDIGTKLTAATGPAVAFEVDHLDPASRSAWSVVVHGTARQVDALGCGAALALVHLSPWVISMKPHLVRIIPNDITGRRVHRAAG